ncbi:MAG: carboxypeptidase M32 [Thermoproteota archaeon]|jgi:carboxypeptidase Pfu. Metallo peptidase. MEROPS family M32
MQDLIKQILKEYKKVWALRHAMDLLAWDIETNMPVRGSVARGEATAELEILQKGLLLSVSDLVEKAKNIESLDDFEKGVIRVLEREIRFYKKIPEEIILELNKVTSEGTIAWRIDRKNDEFKEFKPYLERVIELNRIISEKLGYEKHPYDALLDLYEEGLTVADMENIFSKILKEIPKVLQKELPSSHELENFKYDINGMKKVNEEILNILKMPKDRFRMDVSAHPFTTSISFDDVRVTTRYEGVDFRRSLFSTIHECGHAIYNLNISKDLEGTPVGRGASSGVHESQSRFWENFIGRSKEFVYLSKPILTYLNLPKEYTLDDLYIYFNLVKPSLIRVDADELTYNFHIAVRFEIEKRLLNSELQLNELHQFWNELMEKYLKIKPKGYSDGFLQDIHWSKGWIGYFPTYTLGNVIAAIIWNSLKDLNDKIHEGDFEYIKEYLKEKIHKYGAIYPPKELIKKSFGVGYDAENLIRYLKTKYENI